MCLDPCARLKIQVPIHSISWGCPKIVHHCDPISLLINTFGIHLEPGCKIHEQIIHYHTAKNVLNKRQFCSIFRRIYKVTWKGFPIVWPASTEIVPASHGTVPQSELEKVQLKLELLEQRKARAAQTRARAQWVEKGEKNTFFSQPGKNSANAKIMESIKTDNGQIVTNQSGILHAQKNLLC